MLTILGLFWSFWSLKSIRHLAKKYISRHAWSTTAVIQNWFPFSPANLFTLNFLFFSYQPQTSPQCKLKAPFWSSLCHSPSSAPSSPQSWAMCFNVIRHETAILISYRLSFTANSQSSSTSQSQPESTPELLPTGFAKWKRGVSRK